MRIALIGMSGIGKSYWSLRLQEAGFKLFCVDEIITKKLAREIDPSLKIFDDLLRWFGSPAEMDYQDRASRFLALEARTFQEIATNLISNENLYKTNIVIDTTGSAIYAPPSIWGQLRQSVRVIYLTISPAIRSVMLADFLMNPRPLIWNILFQPESGESLRETYRRCYPKLLEQREKLYERYSDKRIDYHKHRRPNFSTEDFLQEIISK